jgi:hypothetical protein
MLYLSIPLTAYLKSRKYTFNVRLIYSTALLLAHILQVRYNTDDIVQYSAAAIHSIFVPLKFFPSCE